MDEAPPAAGPLAGTRIIELGGIGPGPLAGMILSDLGAEVIQLDRPGGTPGAAPILARGRRTLTIDLKQQGAAEVVLRLVESADAAFEGFRPGVAERMGIGPDACLARNPRLVYGRVTGWGQSGPLSMRAGHDLNYLAISGVLDLIGRAGQPPTPPLNLVGDYGGGSMLLVVGLLAGILSARTTGAGQVIDAAMIDGASLLATIFYGMGAYQGPRGTNILDSGAPFYDVYETADGKWVSLAAIEPQFYREMLDVLGLDETMLGAQMDRSTWEAGKRTVAAAVRTRTRDEWVTAFAGREACFAPVLTVDEAVVSDHAVARSAYVDLDGVRQPSPAPRFSRTPSLPPASRAPVPPDDEDRILRDAGFGDSERDSLRRRGIVGSP